MMRKIHLPYGMHKIEVDIPERNPFVVAETRDLPALHDPVRSVKEALLHPLNSETIQNMARSGMRVLIVTSDIMRPGNYRQIILPIVLEELAKSNITESDVTILNAVGAHQMNTHEEMEELYGERIVKNVKVLNHDCQNRDGLIDLGFSERGDPVIVNKLLTEADLVIGIGCIQPSVPTCGYCGGVKLYSIGAAGIRTIFETHRAKTYWHPTARSGVTVGNEFRERIDSVGKKIIETCKAKFFTINAVTNSKTEMIGVYAGDSFEVYKKGVELAERQWRVKIPKTADILLASVRHPQASNPYEINISMAMPIRYPTDVLKNKGVFVFAGICDSMPKEGTGSYEFLKLMREYCEADEIINEVENARNTALEPTLTNFMRETRAYGTALTLKEFSKVMVARPKFPGLIRDMHYTPVSTIEKALEKAIEIMGNDADILVIPNTRGMVAYVEDQFNRDPESISQNMTIHSTPMPSHRPRSRAI
jgi:nickel-dependent lactate racemase